MRRATSSALRLLARGLQSEGAATGLSSIAGRSVLVSGITGLQSCSAVSAPRAFSTSALRASDMEPYTGIYYPESEVEVGCPAPEFTTQAVVDGEIKSISLSDYKGKYVVLFWYPKARLWHYTN